MIGLDVADLVVIASEVLGCDTGTALAQADVTTADDALAQAGVAGKGRSPGEIPAQAAGAAWPHPADAAEAATILMDALLRHPPFPAHRQQVAAAAGLQFLAVTAGRPTSTCPGPRPSSSTALPRASSRRRRPPPGW